MKIATLSVITRGQHVLLGEKRGGPEIGEGKLSGSGGKQEPGESLLECVIRETREEFAIELDPAKTEKVAIITFYANGTPDFEVHVYHSTGFTGEPRETESMFPPNWYPFQKLPFERMYDSDAAWYPTLLAGKRFRAEVYYRQRAKDFERIVFSPFAD